MTSKPITHSVGYSVTRSNVYTVASQSGTTPVLNNLSVLAAAAYGLRKLNQAYSGNAIRVRRSSDNQELDIGFAADGDLNQSALTTFVGANNGFVSIWYDQSGNARNASQATVANQPQIVANGTITVQKGKPTLTFDGVADDLVTSATISHNGSFSINVVGRSVTGDSDSFVQVGAINDAGSLFVETSSYIARATTEISALAAKTSWSAGDGLIILTGSIANLQSSIFKNGTVGVNATPVSVAASNKTLTIGSLSSGVYALNGNISELIYFINSNLSISNRNLLERNQGAYYGITVA